MSNAGKRSFVNQIIVGKLVLSTVLKNLKVARTLAVGVVAALVIAGMAGSAGAAVSGLVADWHFDGNAQDSSGSGNNGAISGATFVQGISGQALSFDGVDDMVVVPHSPSLSLEKYTMEAWIKIYEFGTHNVILRKRYEPSWMDNYGLAISPNGTVNAGSYSQDIWTWFGAGSVRKISAGEWYHIAATYDRTTFKIYINGVLGNSVNIQYSPYQNNQQLVIGRACDGDPCLFRPSAPSFNGIIDEVRIYNRALSASEIQAEYNALTTGSISVTTNLAGATFSLTGASSYSGSGTSWSTANAPAGTYTITYGTVTGYNTPPSETKTLSAGGSITFSGTYVPKADTAKGFEDDFNNKLLDPSMQVIGKVPGLGRYSLTDNPGYLRYYLEGSRGSMGGWRGNYQASGGWTPSLTLIRPFDGEKWTLRTKVNYNLRAHDAGSSTGAQGQSFWIAFGEGTDDYLNIYRGVDWWYKSNVLTMELFSNGVSVAKFNGVPSQIGADGWVRESYWYEITKDGGKITVRFSNDGIKYTTAFSALLTKPVTITQRAIIDMNLWNGVGSYVDWDYIHVEPAPTVPPTTVPPTTVPPTTIPPTTIPPTTVPPTTVPPTITPPSSICKEPREKLETALKNFREAEDKLKVAEAKFEPQIEQFQAEKEAFESTYQSPTKDEKEAGTKEEKEAKKAEKKAKKAELQKKGEEIKRLGEELQKIVKEFLGKRIDLLILDIEVLKCDAKSAGNGEALPFDASATLDKHIMELEQVRTKVEQASKKQDMKSINQDLKNIKQKFELEKRYFNGIRINNNMDEFFAKTDDASVRMNEIIKKLNENGKDTSKLTSIVSDFNNLMNEAKDEHKKNLDLFREHSGFDSSGMVTDIRKAQDFVRQIKEQQKDTKRMKSAIAKLREFFGETNRLIKGTQESAAPATGGVTT